MSDAYIQMLIDSQEKKIELLDKAIELDSEQETIITGKDPDVEALNANLTAKGAIIDELNKLDEGFESVYEKVRQELMDHMAEHRDEIAKLQELIRQVMDRTTRLEAEEARAKLKVESFLKKRRKSIKSNKSTMKAANAYSSNMRKVNRIDPFFLDNKN